MRYLLIDHITSFQESSIAGNKYLSISEEIFAQHFPKFPVYPAAFLTECALQLARLLIWKRDDFKFTLVPKEYSKFRFKRAVFPGSILEIRLELKNEDKNYPSNQLLRFVAVGKVLQEEAFRGLLTCYLTPFDRLHNLIECQDYWDYLEAKDGPRI